MKLLNKTIIAGIDYSVNSPSCVWVKLDKNLDIIKSRWICFTTVKKYKSENVLYFNKSKNNPTFLNYIDKNNWIQQTIWQKICEWSKGKGAYQLDYAVFEDYAYAAKGQVFHIAEATYTMKKFIFDTNIPIRLYPPNHIKLFATGKGDADKFQMEKAFEADNEKHKPDLSSLPLLQEQKTNNPRDNAVDAYYAMKLLQTELKLRSGLLQLKDLPEHQIKVFNLVTKSFSTNILARNFLQRGVKYE